MSYKRILITLAIIGVGLMAMGSAVPAGPEEDCIECREFTITWLEECLRDGDPIPYCVESFNELWEVCDDWFCDPITQ
jgi:hypothetical protein